MKHNKCYDGQISQCFNFVDVDFAETGCASSSSSSFFKMKPKRRNIGCMGGTNKGLD